MFRDIGVAGFVDITLVALTIYALLAWLKRTKRSALALAGILIVTMIYLLAQQFDLRLTVAVLQGFFAVSLVAIVVIFQEEFRYFFERVAHWSLQRRLPRRRRRDDRATSADTLARTLFDLGRQRIGALVVLRGRDVLDRHLSGGQRLGGEVSEALLKSLFDPHSIGHDGAVVIVGNAIEKFGCHLPLSRNENLLHGMGTRHAAALGLAERTDACCVIVSEERGAVSVARQGEIRVVDDASRLREAVRHFFEEVEGQTTPDAWYRFVTRNLPQKAVSVLLALAMWFVLVHGSTTVYRTFLLPVELAHVPPELVVTAVDPPVAQVTLSGPRKSFYLTKPEHIRLAVRTWDLVPGSTTLTISATDLTFPGGLVFETAKPRQVVVDVADPESDAP